ECGGANSVGVPNCAEPSAGRRREAPRARLFKAAEARGFHSRADESERICVYAMSDFWSRRDFLFRSGGGLSGVALAWLLEQQGMLAADRAASSGACDAKLSVPTPFTARKPHFAPRATSVISLFMSGGVSHVDTFDPKPALRKYAGEPLTGKGEVVVRQGNPGPLMPSPFTFRKYGQSGIDVSEIFPQLAQHVDEMAILRSVYGSSNDHVQAHYLIAT